MEMRNRRVTSGFSMIELLVTVLLAGIIFAAMVPVFASALKKTSQDNFRVTATNIAQDRIEKIRTLDFIDITTDNLNDSSFADNEFGTTFVAEYGRELWEAKSGVLVFDDLLHIAEEQLRREQAALLRARQYVFCDTSPLTTLFYSKQLFGKADPSLERLAGRIYDATILCAPDFTFVQDGTRQPESFRRLQHEWYGVELSRRGVSYLLVTGSLEARIDQVRKALSSRT